MALDTGERVAWHWVLEVDPIDAALPTRRFADQDLAMTDGFAEGRLSDISQPVDKDLGPAEESSAVFADVDVVFEDPDGAIYAEADEGWANATATLYVGQGLTLADYQTFTFTVEFPGMLRRGFKETTLKLRDKRNKDATVLPPNAFQSSVIDATDSVQTTAASTSTIAVADGTRFHIGELVTINLDTNSGDGYRVTGVASGTITIAETVSVNAGETISPLHYANLESKSEGKSIPILYGDYRTTIGPQMVKAVCIDTTVPRFRICDHAIPSGCLTAGNNGQAVLEDATGDTDVTSDLVNIDYDRATFELGSTPYDPSTDTIYVHCQGFTDDATSSGTMVTLLTGIWESILTYWMHQATTDIDQTALTAWQGKLSSDKGRVFLDASESTTEILSSLYFDAFSDGDFRDGKYYPLYRNIFQDSAATPFDKHDVVDDGIGRGTPSPRYSTITDGQLYLNRANFAFRFDPRKGSFAGTGKADRLAEQSRIGSVKARNLEFRWLYDADDASDRASLEALAFASDVEVLNVTLTQRSMNLNLGDNISFSFDIFSEQQFLIRRISYDIARLVTEVEAWNVADLGVSVWTSATAPTWSLASTNERKNNGFWTDTVGQADSSDPSSVLVSVFL